jgi:hypothetical protein
MFSVDLLLSKKGWGSISIIVSFALSALLCGSFLCSCSDTNARIKIMSYMVRDRVIPLDTIEMRSMIIVAFKILPKRDDATSLTVSGELYHNGKLLSRDEVPHLDAPGGNLGFDIPLTAGDFRYEKPYSIPEGNYLIILSLFDDHRRLLAQCTKDLKRNQLERTFRGFNAVLEPVHYVALREAAGSSKRLNQNAKVHSSEEKDYLVFKKSHLERVYSQTEPDATDFITVISTEISRNECQSLTFSIRAFKYLGRVRVTVTSLRGKHGVLGGDSIRLKTVGELTEIVDREKDTVHYRRAPRIIEEREVSIPQRHTQTYWGSIRVSRTARPGDYHGMILIKPQFGKKTEIPIHIKVLPLELTDTDIQFGMMMDYVFYELDNSVWTEKERSLIKQRGIEIYRDFREHGITMIYPHSHFYFKTDRDGQPVLESLQTSLQAYKEVGFPGPFCWYLGHLLQTAKPKHPGSILNYDRVVAARRLRILLKRYESIGKELGIPKEKLSVQLVDEPDSDDHQRVKAGKELSKIAEEMGFRTLVTRPWADVDIICTGAPDDDNKARKLKQMGKQWWIYPNGALTGKNLAYTRYVFGFGAWRWGVTGVVPWTFQMSQGSNGNPFTVLDGPEVMVAYPGVNGPIPTPIWEVIREGINDYKYIYLLEKLISNGKSRGNPKAERVERQLQQFKEGLGKAPGEGVAQFGDWPFETFTKKRRQIVEWSLDLQKDLERPGEAFSRALKLCYD